MEVNLPADADDGDADGEGVLKLDVEKKAPCTTVHSKCNQS